MKKLITCKVLLLSIMLIPGVSFLQAQDRSSNKAASDIKNKSAETKETLVQDDSVKPLNSDGVNDQRRNARERVNQLTPDQREGAQLNSDEIINPVDDGSSVILKDETRITISKEEYYKLEPERRIEIDSHPDLYIIR